MRVLVSSVVASVAVAALLTGCARGGWQEPPASPSASVASESSVPAAPSLQAAVSAEYSYHFSDDPIAAGSFSARRAKQPAKGPPAPAKPPAKGPAKGAPPAPPVVSAAPDPAAQAPALHREALLIYTATLAISVPQVDLALARVEAISARLGGYLASRNDASIVVRVPRARFQEMLVDAATLGEVLHRNVQAEDVSDQVVDLEVRLKNARAVRDRLAQLLQGATATKDALEIEKELARVTGDIESMEGKLQLFTDRIAYSTVTVSFMATSTVTVRSKTRLPFPWLEQLGLSPLLEVR